MNLVLHSLKSVKTNHWCQTATSDLTDPKAVRCVQGDRVLIPAENTKFSHKCHQTARCWAAASRWSWALFPPSSVPDSLSLVRPLKVCWRSLWRLLGVPLDSWLLTTAEPSLSVHTWCHAQSSHTVTVCPHKSLSDRQMIPDVFIQLVSYCDGMSVHVCLYACVLRWPRCTLLY